MVKTDIVDVELTTGSVHRSFMNEVLGEGDAATVVFGARLFRAGEPVNLAGKSAVGYFIRADGHTEVISGGLCAGNVVQVTLPGACFDVEGGFTLAIKAVDADTAGTVRIVDGTVVNTSLTDLYDPDSVIPDLSELEDAAEAAEAAADTVAGFSVIAEQIDGDEYRMVITTAGNA